MRRLTRTAVSVGLSLAMAFGCVPTQALAEAIEEVAVEQDEETGAPIELEASEEEAQTIGEDLPAEEDLVEVDDPTADVPEVVEDETDGDPDEQEDDIILTTQSEIVASGTWGTCPWEISEQGVLTVYPGTGADTGGTSPWLEHYESITSVRFVAKGEQKVLAPADCSALFGSYYDGTAERWVSISATSMDLSGLDTSAVTNMYRMFEDCFSLASVDVSNWDTSAVTNMNRVFEHCPALKTVNVSGWDTSNVENMNAMFYECSALETLDVSNWNTSSVTDMSWVFYGCSSLAALDVSDWDTSNVETMHTMFYDCSALKTLDVAGWNTSSVTDMSWAFRGCSSLITLDLSGWDTSNVTDMLNMFALCSSLTSLDLSSWITSGVTEMSEMFFKCSSLESLSLFNWDTSQVTGMEEMFSGCSSLEFLDLYGWDTSNVTNMSYMFYRCRSLTLLNVAGWNTSSVAQAQGMFSDCAKLASVKVGTGCGQNLLAKFPDGEWTSAATGQSYAPAVLAANRAGIADTYTKVVQDDRTDISAATVTVAGRWTYTGRDIEPTPTVTLGGATLRPGTDYTLSYADHKNAGTATVTATGAGDYKGTAIGTFRIAPAEITSIDDIADVAWTGGEATPALVVRAGDLLLGAGDYDVSYEGDRTKVGTVTVTVAAKGNFAGVLSKAFNIVRAPDDPEAQGSVYQELVGLRDDAQRAADAAVEVLAEKEQAYQDALAALETVQAESEAERSRLEAAVENAQAALASAEEDRDEKQQALEGANAAVAANASAIGAAEADLAARQATAAQKQSVVEAAQSAVDAAQGEYDNAAAAVAAAQATIDAEVPNPGTNANHEEWTALGLFRYILANTSASDEAHWDAQCAIDILTGGTNTTGHSYKTYQGPVPDGTKASTYANISDNIDWASRADAVSLDNFSAALGFIDEYNEYRARENREEGCSLSTNVGMNCRLMAVAAVQLDVSQDIDASGGHTQAYHVGENLSWGYRDPFDGWYVEEKDEWKKGATSGVGHYMNIVDQLPKGTQNPTMGTGFAVHTAAPRYGVAHGQVFHTTSGYDVYNPNVTYGVSEFRAQWFDAYYQQQVEAGMFGTTEAQKEANRSALSDAQENQREKKTALDNAKAALAAATSERDAANGAVATAQTTLDGLRGQTAGLEAAVSTAQGELDEAEAGVTQRQADYDAAVAASNSFDGAAQVQAAQAVVDAAVAERDAAQTASDEAATRLGEAMGAFGAAMTIADQNAVVEGVSDVTYDGREQTQSNARLLIVMRGSDGREEAYELERGTDYDVTFSENKNAGTATMVFSATGLYAGGTSVTFQIAPATVSSVEVSDAYTYTGSPIQPKLTVKAGGLTLGTGDFTATCTNNTNAGTAHIKVTGKGNFKGSKEADFQIAQASLANAKVTAADQTFSGSELRPVPTVTLGNKAIPAEEYAASYKDNTNAGTATVTVTARADGNYVGSAQGAFTIAKASVSSVSLKAATATYDGKAHKPEVSSVLAGKLAATYATTLLRGDKVTSDFTSAGTVTVRVTGTGNFGGTKTATFTIARAGVAVPKATNRTYNGKAQTGVAAGAGYKLTGTASATAAGTYKATATPDANHKWADGTTAAKTISWTIARASVAVPKATNRTYNGKAQTGVAAGAGYKLTGTASATAAGTYKATATPDANHKWADGTTAAKTVSWTIAKAASSISLAAQTKTYTGKALAYTGKVTKSGSAGKVTYAYYSDAKCTKAVKAADVKAAKTYYVRATLAADANHKGATSAAAKLTIAKAANPLVAKAAAKTVAFSKVKSKAQTVAPVTVTKAQGAKSFSVAKWTTAKAKSYFTVNKTTGKVTAKKGTPKGAYKFEVKVSAKGNANYKAGSKTVACTVTVK